MAKLRAKEGSLGCFRGSGFMDFGFFASIGLKSVIQTFEFDVLYILENQDGGMTGGHANFGTFR